jgi:hypothetical protein
MQDPKPSNKGQIKRQLEERKKVNKLAVNTEEIRIHPPREPLARPKYPNGGNRFK